jgi:hypothetical protein
MHSPEFPSREWNGNELFYSIVRLIPVSLIVIMHSYGWWDGNTLIMCKLRTFPVSCLKVGLSWPRPDIVTHGRWTGLTDSRIGSLFLRSKTDRLDKIPVGSGPGKSDCPTDYILWDRFLSLNQAISCISCHIIKNSKTNQPDQVPASGFGRVGLTLWPTPPGPGFGRALAIGDRSGASSSQTRPAYIRAGLTTPRTDPMFGPMPILQSTPCPGNPLTRVCSTQNW